MRASWVIAGLCLGSTACPKSAMDEARTLEAEQHKEQAAARYREIAQADPANLAAWDGAVRLWCDALARVDECVATLDMELHLLGDLGRHRDALAAALERRGRLRLDQGLVAAALTDFERAQAAGPRRASILVAKAKAFAAQGVRHLAEQSLEAAKKLDPTNEEIDAVARTLPADEGFGGDTSE